MVKFSEYLNRHVFQMYHLYNETTNHMCSKLIKVIALQLCLFYVFVILIVNFHFVCVLALPCLLRWNFPILSWGYRASRIPVMNVAAY